MTIKTQIKWKAPVSIRNCSSAWNGIGVFRKMATISACALKTYENVLLRFLLAENICYVIVQWTQYITHGLATSFRVVAQRQSVTTSVVIGLRGGHLQM